MPQNNASEGTERASATHRLDGLEPDNLLAFLALLGLLRALDRARPQWRARAAWCFSRQPLRPKLTLAEATTSGAVADAASDGVSALAEGHDFGGRRDLNHDRNEARGAFAARDDEMFGSLMSDGAVREDGRIWPTPFCFLFGQGHQHFLERLASVPAEAAPPPRGRGRRAIPMTPRDCLLESLFRPWERRDQTNGFRWDPAEDRRYALRAVDPSGDPAGLQHGANRLAAAGLPVLTGAAVLRRRETRFLARGTAFGGAGEIRITWPLWTRPARLSGIKALLAHPALARETVDLSELTALGVAGAMRAARVSVGKFFNVSWATKTP